MIREDEFTEGLDRLVKGLGIKPVPAAQRAGLFDAIVRSARLSSGEWRRVVDLALASGRWPSVEQWEKYVERARSSSQGQRSSPERRCECGTGTYEPVHRSRWIFLGTGRWSSDTDPDGARDRVEHPGHWLPVSEYACSACSAAGWLVQGEGTNQRTGRTYRGGDFVTSAVWRRVPPPEEAIPATDHAFDRSPERAEAYQLARRAILKLIARDRPRPAAVADLLLELADAFPEKADTLVAEARVTQESGPRSRLSGIYELDEERPETPTIRDAGLKHCDHLRIRGPEDGVICADCGATETHGVWLGGTIDALRWPWTAAEASRFWVRRMTAARSGTGSGTPPSAGTSDASPVPDDSSTRANREEDRSRLRSSSGTRPPSPGEEKVAPESSGERTGADQFLAGEVENP
jgi:hypothetical protein